jgi:CheY-like chemotaxis protein/HPt (histidine-containing phosphotransfer) domain-containing protein
MEKTTVPTVVGGKIKYRLRRHYVSGSLAKFRGRLLLHPAPLADRPIRSRKDVAEFMEPVTKARPRGFNFTKLTELVKETSIGPIVAEPFLNKQEMHLYDILVVEEDEMSRLIMGMVLKRNFLTYKFAHTPQEAAEKFLNDEFRLMIVGLDDPAIRDKGLQEIFKRTQVPVLGMSAHAAASHIPTSLMRMGFREMLGKPYHENDLLKLIHKYMKNDKPTEELSANGGAGDQFNLEQLNRIGSNDREFMVKMLEKFVISASECSEALAAAAPARDWKALKGAAHKSIPSYSLMGLSQLMNDLAFIDQHAGEEARAGEVIEKAHSVEKRNEKVIADVNAHIAKLKEEMTTG